MTAPLDDAAVGEMARRLIAEAKMHGAGNDLAVLFTESAYALESLAADRARLQEALRKEDGRVQAWYAVVDALTVAFGGDAWLDGADSGIVCAVKAIQTLKAAQERAEGERDEAIGSATILEAVIKRLDCKSAKDVYRAIDGLKACVQVAESSATAAEQRAAELEGALGRAVAIAEFWAPDEALVKPEEDRDWNLHIDQLQAARALLTPKP